MATDFLYYMLMCPIKIIKTKNRYYPNVNLQLRGGTFYSEWEMGRGSNCVDLLHKLYTQEMISLNKITLKFYTKGPSLKK